ncbi:MAG: hypothetical protein IJZ31_06810 [Bacteroidaceae bacterium]|nr:hypothetical protein [Bacteroidaceae bacterium]
MKKFLMMAALMVATLTVSAQDYNWAVGVRGGALSGLTAKKNLGGNAIEAGLSLGTHTINVEGTYQWQQPIITDGFNLYYGVGAYAGLYTFENTGYLHLGAEGVLGLEYKIPGAPIALSVDYRPTFNILGGFGHSNFYNFGLGVKFCF